MIEPTLEEQEYLELADTCLEHYAAALEDFDPDEVDFFSADGVLTIEFLDNRSLASLRKGERIFLKHFGNMQSWGVHGRNVSGMALTNVTLWSVSGMGYRCDLCLGRYSLADSDIAIKPGTDRPMSITADAVHFMHHAGHIELRRSSFEGGGDDGFNVRIISGPSAL